MNYIITKLQLIFHIRGDVVFNQRSAETAKLV